MESRILRVAQVIGITGCGGVEAVIMNYYRFIDHSKIQFDFFVESTSKIIDKKLIESMGGRVIIIPSYSNPFKYIKTLTRLFKEGNYDIVHSNMNALSVFTLKAAKNAGIKVRIAHSHSTANKKEWKKTIVKNLLKPFSKKYPTHLFTCSEYAGEWLFGKKTMKENKVEIINNAIDLGKYKFDEIKRQEMRQNLNISEDEFIIGNIGRFMQQKNHDYLIDIFYKVFQQNNKAKLLLLGDGPLKEDIIKKVENLGLKANVLFLGMKADAYNYYQAMDCFILPSLYEGLPVVGIEAQSNGLKCLLSTKMTKETKIIDSTEFIEIRKDNLNEWVTKILSINPKYDRLMDFPKIENSKYNIVNEAKKLEELYVEMIK